MDLDGDDDLVVSNGDLYWYENMVPQDSIIVSSVFDIDDSAPLAAYPTLTSGVLNFDSFGSGNYQASLFLVSVQLVRQVNVQDHLDLGGVNECIIWN